MSEDIRQLAAQLAAVQSQARLLGLFTNDRELLICPPCGLMENVGFDGRLFTCRANDLENDSGLRFEERTPSCFRCPACGAAACEEAGE